MSFPGVSGWNLANRSIPMPPARPATSLILDGLASAASSSARTRSSWRSVSCRCWVNASAISGSPASSGARRICVSACSSIEWTSVRYLTSCSLRLRSVIFLASVPSWLRLKQHLDGAVFLLLEHLVGLRRLVERQLVCRQVLRPKGIAVLGDERQDVLDPPLDIRLAHPDLDLLVEQVHHGKRVKRAAVHAGH